MKAIKKNKQTFKEAFIWCTFILAVFPILTFGLRSVFTILWSLLGITCYFSNKEKNQSQNNKWLQLSIIVFIAPFLYLLLSLIYSENLDAGLNRLIQMLPLIVYPVIFYLNTEKSLAAAIK